MKKQLKVPNSRTKTRNESSGLRYSLAEHFDASDFERASFPT